MSLLNISQQTLKLQVRGFNQWVNGILFPTSISSSISSVYKHFVKEENELFEDLVYYSHCYVRNLIAGMVIYYVSFRREFTSSISRGECVSIGVSHLNPAVSTYLFAGCCPGLLLLQLRPPALQRDIQGQRDARKGDNLGSDKARPAVALHLCNAACSCRLFDRGGFHPGLLQPLRRWRASSLSVFDRFIFHDG